MQNWKAHSVGKRPKINNPVLIEGLPGIGNVGKIVVDFIIDELNAKKIFEFQSYSFPHSVFVNEDNVVELPTIEIYHKKTKSGKDILLLAGDVQPIDEISCYKFSEKVLDILETLEGTEVITLGGIGLPQIPKKPTVYCTANKKGLTKQFKNIDDNLYGVVGPIVGVSGLLLGLAGRRKIDGVSFLAETYGHPMYLGLKGAKEILSILNKKYKLNISIKRFDNEIAEIEEGMLKKTEDLNNVVKKSKLKKLKGAMHKDTSYIG